MALSLSIGIGIVIVVVVIYVFAYMSKLHKIQGIRNNLATMAQDPDPDVRLEALKHDFVSWSVVNDLCYDSDINVRLYALSHSKTLPCTLRDYKNYDEKLYAVNHREVCLAILRNPNVTMPIVEFMLLSNNSRVRMFATRRLDTQLMLT